MINNKINELVTLKMLIEDEIKKYYKTFLTLSLDPNTPPTKQNFSYTWTNSVV